MAPKTPLDRWPIVISGLSGVGKGTLCQKLCNAHPDTFAMTTSHTTRKPRTDEIDGVTYFFVSPSTFTSLVSQNGFVEHTFFSGNFYGTSQQAVAKQTEKGLTVVLEVEMNGVKQMKTKDSIDARYIFTKPPSLGILEARLRDRGTESEENIQRRLAQAQAELDYADVLALAIRLSSMTISRKHTRNPTTLYSGHHCRRRWETMPVVGDARHNLNSFKTRGMQVQGMEEKSCARMCKSQALAGLDFSSEEIRAALAGAKSTVFTNVTPEIRQAVIEGIVKAIGDKWILVIVAGTVTLIAGVFVRWERLFTEASAGV